MKELWTEKYRPKLLKDYVVRDDNQRQQIQGWIRDGANRICYSQVLQAQARPHWLKCCSKS